MARRIKEEPIVHQNRIAQKAMILFSKKGIDNTTMDDIARLAGYGKATLYVYFKNKKEIVSFLAEKSMERLKDSLEKTIEKGETLEDIFFSICDSLVRFEEEAPEFFYMSLDHIEINKEDSMPDKSRAYTIGEEINQMLISLFEEGIRKGEIKKTDNLFETIFFIWGMISGLISLASKKRKYIKLSTGKTKEEFLQEGFKKIFMIIKQGAT